MTELPPIEPLYLSYSSEQPASKGLAIASMVCGICSIPLIACAWFFAIPTAIVAVVLGLVARKQIRRGQAAGKGMATAGIICGSCALVFLMVIISAVVVFVGMNRNAAWMKPTTGPASGTVTTTWTSTIPASPKPVLAPRVAPGNTGTVNRRIKPVPTTAPSPIH